LTPDVSVLIADDHGPTRADLRGILDQHPRFRVCAEVPDAITAVEAATRLCPDVCLLDIRMPGNGIAAAWEIAARVPDARIVMLTVSESDTDLFRALRAGAAGYLTKDLDPERLPHILLDVLDGEAAIPRAMVARVVAEFRDRGPRRRPPADGLAYPLTSREWEVLDLLRRRSTTGEIASRLSISKATARSHIASVVHKLGATDRDEAVRLLSVEHAGGV
jgi:DNA-binding NarL/FixJ family response regulator